MALLDERYRPPGFHSGGAGPESGRTGGAIRDLRATRVCGGSAHGVAGAVDRSRSPIGGSTPADTWGFLYQSMLCTYREDRWESLTKLVYFV